MNKLVSAGFEFYVVVKSCGHTLNDGCRKKQLSSAHMIENCLCSLLKKNAC